MPMLRHATHESARLWGASSCFAWVRPAACGLIVVTEDKAFVMPRKGGDQEVRERCMRNTGFECTPIASRMVKMRRILF